MDHAASIKERALQLGFSKCGIISVDAVRGYKEKLDERIAELPESSVIYNKFYSFADVREKFPWSRSLVVCVFDYNNYKIPENVRGRIGTIYLFDGRRDKNSDAYQARNELTAYMESIGIRVAGKDDRDVTALRFAAEKAGLGKIRRNNFFYTEKGSWNYIDVFVIDKELELIEQSYLKQCPKDCDKCILACPTRSLTRPLTMNPLRCVSYLTARGGGTVDLVGNPVSKEIGKWIYGCDDCQSACPFNKNRFTEDVEYPGLAEMAGDLSPEKIIDMDDEYLLNVVFPKFRYLGLDKKWVWKVNALNAMNNDYQKMYDAHIIKCLDDPDERVRRMAEWVRSIHKDKNESPSP